MISRIFFAALLVAASPAPLAQAQTAGSGQGGAARGGVSAAPGAASTAPATAPSEGSGNANAGGGPLNKGKPSQIVTQTDTERREQQRADHDMNICKGC